MDDSLMLDQTRKYPATKKRKPSKNLEDSENRYVDNEKTQFLYLNIKSLLLISFANIESVNHHLSKYFSKIPCEIVLAVLLSGYWMRISRCPLKNTFEYGRKNTHKEYSHRKRGKN
jgi:hypothetical protein